MIKIECNEGNTHCEFINGDFFEACCIMATLIQKFGNDKIDGEIIKAGVESALKILKGKEDNNE